MALIFFDGFEAERLPSVRGWTQSYNWTNATANTIDTTVKRSGGASLKLSGTSGGNYFGVLTYNTDVSTDLLVVGFGCRFGTFITATEWFCIQRSDGSRMIKFFIDSSGYIYATDSGSLGSGNRLFTIPSPFGPNTWYYMQVKVKSDPINGQVTVLVGNDIAANVTGLNTSCTDNKLDRFYFQQYGGYVGQLWVDDIYVVNNVPPTNDFVGICSIAGSRPMANGDVLHFETSSEMEAYDCVDDQSANTTDYVYGDGLNEKALFQMQDVTTIGDIKGVAVFDYAARSEEGQGWSKYKMVLRNEADQEYESDEVTLFDSNWRTHTWLFESNPITDTTWDMTSVNELQLGVKVTQVD